MALPLFVSIVDRQFLRGYRSVMGIGADGDTGITTGRSALDSVPHCSSLDPLSLFSFQLKLFRFFVRIELTQTALMAMEPWPAPHRLLGTPTKPAATSQATPLPTVLSSSTLLCLRMASKVIRTEPLNPSRLWKMSFVASVHSSGIIDRRWILCTRHTRAIAETSSPRNHPVSCQSCRYPKASLILVTVILSWSRGNIVPRPDRLGFVVESSSLASGRTEH